MDCSLPRSSVHGILQTRILEWAAIPFSRGSSQPRDWTWVFCIAGRFFTIWTTREVQINWKWLNDWNTYSHANVHASEPQPRSGKNPSVYQEMNDKTWWMYAMEQSSAIKRNGVLTQTAGWSLKLSCWDKSDTEHGHCVTHTHECSDGHVHGDGGRAEVSGCWGRGESGAMPPGHRAFVWGFRKLQK